MIPAATPMEERTNATLVTLARSCDKQAFGELIERYQAVAQIFQSLTIALVSVLFLQEKVRFGWMKFSWSLLVLLCNKHKVMQDK